MQITYKGDYGLKAILYLAERYNESVVPMQELAKRLDIPSKFLEQILLELKKGGFVESKRGVNGGYYLLRSPREITLGEIVRFIDGPLEPIACANQQSRYTGCADMHRCVFRDIWVTVGERISSLVDTITFEELVQKQKRQGSNHYWI